MQSRLSTYLGMSRQHTLTFTSNVGHPIQSLIFGSVLCNKGTLHCVLGFRTFSSGDMVSVFKKKGPQSDDTHNRAPTNLSIAAKYAKVGGFSAQALEWRSLHSKC